MKQHYYSSFQNKWKILNPKLRLKNQQHDYILEMKCTFNQFEKYIKLVLDSLEL